jgi:hypothetical protein
MEKETKIVNWEHDFLYTAEYKQLRVKLVSDRMSYIVLKVAGEISLF